jgi:mono/diheme cytochrome c family protein
MFQESAVMRRWIRLAATLQAFVACSAVNAMDADNAATIKLGTRLFNTHFIIFHGVGGQGGEKAPSLVPRLASTDDVALVAYLKTGDPAKGMPAAPIEAAQLPALIAYLRSVTGTSGNARRGSGT